MGEDTDGLGATSFHFTGVTIRPLHAARLTRRRGRSTPSFSLFCLDPPLQRRSSVKFKTNRSQTQIRARKIIQLPFFIRGSPERSPELLPSLVCGGGGELGVWFDQARRRPKRNPPGGGASGAPRALGLRNICDRATTRAPSFRIIFSDSFWTASSCPGRISNPPKLI